MTKTKNVQPGQREMIPRHDRRTTTAVCSGRTDQARDRLDIAAGFLSAVMEQRALPTAKSATRSS
ncbi:hypothetical protein J6590_083894 [Homalodisca vitripennis]|nr:hypothetical protein J6590_083894 [Homalodisca vitripennis]